MINVVWKTERSPAKREGFHHCRPLNGNYRISLLCQSSTPTLATVGVYSQTSQPLKIDNDALTYNSFHQGCILAAALFDLFLDHIVREPLRTSTSVTLQ
jgi:hypothetical protein